MKSRLLPILLSLGLLASASRAADPLFPGAGGDYGGLLEADAGGDPDNSGILTVGLRDSGAATLKLVWKGQVYSLKAPFNAAGVLSRKLTKKATTDGTELDLFCALNADTRTISGTLTDPTADAGASLARGFALSGAVPDPLVTEQLTPGLRMAFIDPTAPAAAPENGATPTTISEDGFSLVTVGRTARRSSRFVGNLPDATKYSAGSPIRGAKYALRAGLYSQKKLGSGGQFLGSGDVAATSAASAEARDTRGISGSAASLIAAFRWHKKKGGTGGIATKSYPGGLDQRVELDTLGYTGGRDLSFVLTGTPNVQRNATLRMNNGNLGTRADVPGPNPITVGLNVTIFGAKIVGANPHKVKLRVNPRTAQFTGSFKHPDTSETMTFRGAFRSFFGVVPGEGRGNFLSSGPTPPRGTPRDPAAARSGSVRIVVN